MQEKCPWLDNRQPRCYCENLTSQNIRLVAEYCLDNYRRCDVYQRLTAENCSSQTLQTEGETSSRDR